ncbi:DUF4177 domain-containing protein [Helcococcus kunzii]|uniref:DUF4177 domain-containing protein n=1 Tax=Helcococcus kunzii TaxID=40091 RepID=UPI001BB09CB9|nr:DUF4177 domain-containing protein [Helcococcus kunzii]MCT1796809.1 DUF4177 domain-containing protein [Helcococcus kunzii]MCT1988367.1 DUF4177 domain-containing protein [Helcococcus kunzii]QUY65524.1 DUF4177 domain-containing protein [Helcococcus kunzii]
MYRYEYVNLNREFNAFSNDFEEYRDIIEEYAKKGYRYAGFIPVKINNNGKITILDLIFEIEE